MPSSPSSPVLPCPEPLVLRGRGRPLAVPAGAWLAPMEGITDRVFRDLVIGLGGVGAACSEFIRVAASPVPCRVVRRHLGPVAGPVPVAVQLMAAGPVHVARSAANAAAAGAAWIDLNFGCPAPVVFGKCAGSALLAHPDAMAAILRAAAAGTGLPVTAKLRAGIADPDRIEENVLALAEAGAAAVALHGRLRVQGYGEPARWEWIARAVAALRRAGHGIPVIGNGGIDNPEQVRAMQGATGCQAVMIGRAALADPFIFRAAAGGPPGGRAEAAAFPAAYHRAVAESGGAAVALARLKQLVRWYRAGGLFAGREAERPALLRCPAADPILAWFAAA